MKSLPIPITELSYSPTTFAYELIEENIPKLKSWLMD